MYSTTESAKLIRKELKAAFPHIKFSVRSKSYSMGSSITVSWVDGVTRKEVEAITSKYEKIRRDSSGEILSGGNMYIHTDRDISPEFQAWAEELYSIYFVDNGDPFDRQRTINDILNFKPEYISCELKEVSTVSPEVEKPIATKDSAEVETKVEEISSDLDRVEPVEVAPYFVEACFAKLNKNCGIESYVTQVQDGQYHLDMVEICWEVKLTVKQWNELLFDNFLTDYQWMKGKGGSNSFYQIDKEFHEMTETELKQWRMASYRANCILVTCGFRSIVIDPQGYTYARYVGINPHKTASTAA